jgi:hypothetical protein
MCGRTSLQGKLSHIGKKLINLRHGFERPYWASAALRAARKGPRSTTVHLRPGDGCLASAARLLAQKGIWIRKKEKMLCKRGNWGIMVRKPE